MVAGGALHAAGVAAEQEADFIAWFVGLVDAHFLAAAARQEDEIGRGDRARGVFEQRTEFAADGAAWDIWAAEGVFDDGVIGSTKVVRSFASSYMEAGRANHFAIQQEFPDEAKFGGGGM